MKVMFLFDFLPPFKGSNTVQLLYCKGFLKYDIILQLCFPRISAHGGLLEGGLICKDDFFRWGLFEGGLLGGRGLIEDLRYSVLKEGSVTSFVAQVGQQK